MKLIRNITIIYTVLMLIALVVLINVVSQFKATMNTVGSYTTEELKIYKMIWDGMNQNITEAYKGIMLDCFLFWLAILLIGYLVIFLIYFTQIKPIREMEDYAMEIAKGNLDVALPIHRGNLFGNFTESFDLMREALKDAKKKELEADKAKRELVAELSHDIKTPVATIQATCEVLDMIYAKKRKELSGSESDEAIKEVDSTIEKIGYISNKADTINQLVGNVFRATLEDMDEIKITPEEVDSRVIEGYFENLKEYGNIIIENHIAECLVYIDKLRMEQVIDNIVGNSYKYAGTDIHVSFDIVTDMPSEDGKKSNFIKVRIKDDGPGVSEEELPLIVEKYYRGKAIKDRNGYGLGLYLVNWYMERQGGGMEYYNDDGFVVELLIKKV